MPVIEVVEKTVVFGSMDHSLLNSNFVIREALETLGLRGNAIESMNDVASVTSNRLGSVS